MTVAIHFTELAVKKAVKAVRNAGLDVQAVSIAPDGTITISQRPASSEPKETPKAEVVL